jgi:endoglucanase
MDLVKEMGIGWNLGNTLDAIGGETAWGNPVTTEAMIQGIAAAGFKSIRIPITWDGHFGGAPNYVIDASWMNRVQEIVDWAMNAGLYTIINLHHDGGWIEGASTNSTGVLDQYKALWAQIAPRFADYSDYLVFESMNEVGFDDMNFSAAVALLNQINSEFATLVRASGGKNALRHLLIAGYWTDTTRSQNVTMPDSRCILSVHFYTPSSFTFGGTTWGSTQEISSLQSTWADVKTDFLDKGIPTILGEYGVVTSTETASRIFWIEYVTKITFDYGIAPFLWDDGGGMGYFNRRNLTWPTGLIEALQRASSGQNYTPTKG